MADAERVEDDDGGDELTVFTYNCNGNGNGFLKWKCDSKEFPHTAMLQKMAKEAITTSTKKIRDIVGNSLDMILSGVGPTVEAYYGKWRNMTFGEFYIDKEVADWRLTSRVDLAGVKIYPWHLCKEPKTCDVNVDVLGVVRPIPAKYKLPPEIQEVSEMMQLIATHILVKCFWEYTNPECISLVSAEMQDMIESTVRRTVDQLDGFLADSDVLMVQELTRPMIDAIDARKDGTRVIFNPTPDAAYYTAIIYHESPNIVVGEWFGSDTHVILPMNIRGVRYCFGAVHGISSTGAGTINAINETMRYAKEHSIERVVVGGDANTCTGDSTATQLGSKALRVHCASVGLGTVVPMHDEPTQKATKSYLRVNKGGQRSEKSCDFLAATTNDSGYTCVYDESVDTLPSRNHVSDHMAIDACFKW
jgi:hypothetical protein